MELSGVKHWCVWHNNILRFVLDSICFLQGYLNNPINNMKIALPTDHVSHMAKRTHLWKAQCTYPRNKYFLTYRNVLISKLQTALIFSIVISVPFNEYSATAVFASYVVLLHAVKVDPKNNNVNGGTSFKSSDCINAFNVMKADDGQFQVLFAFLLGMFVFSCL